jgi:hypothetical protein
VKKKDCRLDLWNFRFFVSENEKKTKCSDYRIQKVQLRGACAEEFFPLDGFSSCP